MNSFTFEGKKTNKQKKDASAYYNLITESSLSSINVILLLNYEIYLLAHSLCNC